MAAYYNEIEPYAAEWLRNLIKAGHIPDGEVDTRSIIDVAPDDLRAFTQCHFFAGIGGWGLALRLARWPDDRPIWTGSCPCQPFSVAGKGAGVDDPRHLWPHFHRLIAACRPPVVMGEQVAGQAGYGWLDGVRADLAREGYASRGVDIPACSVDAPHIRQRLYWVASDMGHADHKGLEGYARHGDGGERRTPEDGPASQTGGGHMADAQNIRREKWERQDRQQDAGSCGESRVDVARTDEGHMADTRYDESQGWVAGQDTSAGASAGNSTWNEPASCRISYGDSHMADANDTERRQDGAGGDDDHRDQAGRDEDAGDIGACNEGDMADADHQRCDGIDTLLRQGEAGRVEGDFHEASGRCSTNSFWSDHIWLTGADGKSRRSKSGLPLLAHGIPNRVGRLRAYGNAIVAQVAAEVIMAFAEAQEPA